MARFSGGWIKVHRTILEHWVGEEIDTLGFFIKLLAMANIKDSKHVRNGDFIIIKRGEILTSASELSVFMRRSRKWIESRLDWLTSDETIEQRKHSFGRIITICNYSDYQDNEKQKGQHSEPQRDSGGTGEAQERHSVGTHSKEVKNNKKLRIKELIHTPIVIGAPVEELTTNPVQEFIAHYCDHYKLKYSTNPVIDGRSAGIAKRVVGSIGLPKAKALIEKYLQMHDQWFITKSHDLSTFEGNLNKIELFKETGKRINAQEAKQEDMRQNNDEAFKRFGERLKQMGGDKPS